MGPTRNFLGLDARVGDRYNGTVESGSVTPVYSNPRPAHLLRVRTGKAVAFALVDR